MTLHHLHLETLVHQRTTVLLSEAERERLANTAPRRPRPTFADLFNMIRRQAVIAPRPQLSSQAGC